MKTLLSSFLLCAIVISSTAQSLLNVDFGVGSMSRKIGFAATGEGTNDFWNLYRHYDPKYVAGSPLVANGVMSGLKFADGSASSVSVAVTNAPGVWGNASGDAMYDGYIFANNGSNILVALNGLAAGHYHLYVYGHADPDVTGEQNSVFTLRSGTNVFGPMATVGSAGWRATSPWGEKAQYVVFRDVPVRSNAPLVIEVAPGANGVAVLNGLQIISRGTSPPKLIPVMAAHALSTTTNLLIPEVKYDGRVTDNEARFHVILEVESLTTNEISVPLFNGDVALIAPKLPDAVRIVSSAKQYRLCINAPGRYTIPLELVAKISRAEPWNQISFTGPPAAIASVNARASATRVEMQLLSGTQLETEQKATSKLAGLLGSDRVLSMRWQSKATEVTRKSLVTVDTSAAAQITPTVVKFTTELRYEILQAPLPRLAIAVPASHALTKLVGEQIRDWQVKPDGTRQLLTVEFIKPVEKSYALTIYSEQTVDSATASTALVPPEPVEDRDSRSSSLQRESGSFTISADDTLVDIDAVAGLRQVNASGGAIAAYRFHGRPIELTARLKRIEPLVKAADRATMRLEETRLLVTHALSLDVERAGIYSLDLIPQAAFAVSEVRGDGVEDWKLADGTLRVTFTNRVLGARHLTVQLEQPLKQFPDSIVIEPLVIAGSTNLWVQIGAASPGGILLKTSELAGLREVSVTSLSARVGDELLAFSGDQQNWKLTLAAEKLSARVIAEVFDLITIGEGLVGGSATIRYGIFNQGVQEFRVALPAHWKNVEFTGPNIRRKEQAAAPANGASNVWTIALQDKAWGAYTLVVTYDYQFDPKGALLDLAGAHALGVERETGSVGVMSGGGLKLDAKPISEPLRRVDESELLDADRALATRPLLLAFKYTGTNYALGVQVTRFEQISGLDAIADRTELTSVLNDQGQMLTQASFMVKNNEKQFQRFRLPAGAEFWSSYVNGQPAKPEKDGDWILVPLPRQANRDLAFVVDIVYAQKIDFQKSKLPQALALHAPLTDVPNTYAEWQLFVPMSQRLSAFGGNMMVAPYTTYELRDAWREFVQFWGNAIDRHLGMVAFGCVVIGVLSLVVIAMQRGAKGVVSAIVVIVIVCILASMMLPALSRAKAKASRISAISNLKQIGLAARLYANDHGGKFPNSFEEMRDELVTDKVLTDPSTGQRFVWIGAGKTEEMPDLVIAYSRSENGGVVALADGSVQQVSTDQLDAMLRRDGRIPVAVAVSGAVAANEPARPPAAAQPTVAFANNGQALVTNAVEALAKSPTATGIRPIRIDIPRIGRAFTFTKVLNVGNESLAVRTSIMKLSTFRTLQMIWQAVAFLIGLGMLWLLWRRAERSSFWLAVGATLVIVSVAGMLLTWRALGFVLIALPPVFVLVIAGWLLVRFGFRKKVAEVIPPIEPEATIPPAMALIALTLFFWNARLGAAEQSFAAARPAFSQAASILSATYTGTVREKVAQFDATVSLSAPGTNQTVALFSDDVAIQEFEVTKGSATLMREGRFVSVLLTNGGVAELRFQFVAKVGGDVTKRQLGFTIPPALSSAMTVTIDEAEADVEFATAVAYARTNLNQETRVTAVLGSTDRVEMNWTPRVKRAAEIAATIFAQQMALVSFGSGVVNTRATFEYQVTQGELRSLRVKLPAAQRLLRVEGDGIRTWELSGDGATLTVDLVKGVSPSYRLTVELEKILEKLPVTARVELPHALDVKRETGMVAVRGSEELALSVDSVRELQRMDTDEFVKAAVKSTLNPVLSSPASDFIGAFRFSRTDFDLVAKAETIQPQIEAVTRNTVRIGFDDVRITARVDYTIKRAGVFILRLGVPAGFKIAGVSGANIQQWIEKGEGATRVVEVVLTQRTMGACALEVALVQEHTALPKTMAVAGVQPLDTQKSSGFVVVTSETGVATKVESFDALTEVPAATLGLRGNTDGTSATLAFKLIGSDPTAAASWKLNVSTETVEPWVRAEVVSYLTLSETLVNGRATVRYDIANAPVREFRVRVPAAFKNVDIAGANIRRRDQNGEEWRVELQSKVRGTFALTVTWESEKSAASNVVEFTGVTATNVEREVGYVIVSAKPPIQVSEKSLGELLTKMDFNELPDWIERPARETVLAFKYLRPGYRLALDVKRYGEAEVLAALVESARLTTVVAEDGQLMTEVSLTVRNNGRQHLEVELPARSSVWSAFVAGEPVRPNVRHGKLMFAMERNADDAPVAIQLTFVSSEKFPKRNGAFALGSPKFDVPVKNTRWDLYLPPDYDYSDFEGGSMTKIAESAPIVQMFSVSGYLSQQSEKAAATKAERRMEVSNVQSSLRGGNVKEAVELYNRARGKAQGQGGADEQQEFVVLEQQLRRAQGTNLIEAQRNYWNDNNARFNGGQIFDAANMPGQQQMGQQGFLNFEYDTKIAELQWSRLEAAQQVAKAKVAPLHINLPTRGVKLSFSQVLQTEVQKPMTVKFHAENTKEIGWPKRVMWSALGFAMLWIGVAGMSRRRSN